MNKNVIDQILIENLTRFSLTDNKSQKCSVSKRKYFIQVFEISKNVR